MSASRSDRRKIRRAAPGYAAAILACFLPAMAAAQDGPADGAAARHPPDEISQGPAIVVRGTRQSVVIDLEPIATFDADTIEATGASTMGELLTALRATTQSADGSDPIFLLNAQRVSGYPEIGSLPPEAIEKVEVMPEPVALRFGFPPTRRVVNFITKSPFRQIETKASAGWATRGGSGTEKANLGLTRLASGARLTLGLEYRRTDPLFLSDRDIAPDPEIPFDAIGNVTGIGGGEIAPALSAAAGRVVTIAPVPQAASDRASLAGFASGANAPRLFELGRSRTLTPRNEAFKAEAVIGDRIGATMAGSVSLSAEQSRNRATAGPAGVRLFVPATSPYSPFGVPVILNRYLTEAAPMAQRDTTTSLHAGFTLRGALAGWRWDLTGSLDQKRIDGLSDRGIDTAAANAAIAAGADPFAPLDPSLLAARLTDRTRLLTRTVGAKTVVTNTPFRLPAGGVSLTATVEAERSIANSASVGANPSELRLGRGRVEGALAIDLPLASRRMGVLPFLGELSVNASIAARHVGGFGSLRDTSFGAAWAPIEGVQWLAEYKRSEAAPDMAQQSTPAARIANVPVFDYVAGRTELVTLLFGGNPDLAAEQRTVRSLGLNVKPFEKSELRFSATYEATRVRDQAGLVYAVTPQAAAILPELFVRDASGRLVSVAYRPINFHRTRQRLLRMTISASGKIGAAPPPPPPGGKAAPPTQVSYYAGIGPTVKFAERLQLRAGTPELDLLAGDTINGNATARIFGYAYGGINFYTYGFTFNAWRGGGGRVRSADPASDLRFSPIVNLNLGGYLSLGRVFKDQAWSRRLRLSLDVSNALDWHQRVRDGDGDTPFRFQPALFEPIGRTVTFTVRKLF